MAQSTVRLIVDAQNAINPLKRVNDQTKILSKNTNALKGRLDKSNRSLRDTGRSAKTAQTGVKGLVGALKPLLAALAVVGTARFVFVKTAELETQRKSLEVLTGSLEKTNKIIKELQDFGSVTPFTSSELIEQSKRLKAFGFETDELADSVKRLSDIAGATGADLSGIATAFGQIRAKGKLQQEENLQLLERGVDITTELKRITGLQGEEFESAMRKGKIGADLVNQAFLNLTDEGGAFFGGATAQADTLNGKLSTLIDTVETLARTVGDELGDEIKTILDLGISAVNQITKLVERVGTANKVGRINLANIAMESRGEARQQTREELGFFSPLTKEGRDRERELFEEIKARKIKEALEAKELEFLNQKDEKTEKITENLNESSDSANKLNKNLKKTEQPITNLENKTNSTITALESNIAISDLFNTSLGETSFLMDEISFGSDNIADSLFNVKTEADELKEKFMEIGQGIESGIVSGLTDAVMGTKSLAEAATGVLNNLKRQLVELAMQRAVSGIGNFFGKALGGIFGGRGGGGGLGGLFGGGMDKGLIPFQSGLLSGGAIGFANGGRPPVGKASIVGEKGPELFVPNSAGNIIPNSKLGGGDSVTNIINVSVDASGSAVSGSSADGNQLGQQLAGAIQAELIKQKRAGGLLA